MIKSSREKNTMSVGVFIDRKHQPSEEELQQIMGPGAPVWEELTAYIRDIKQFLALRVKTKRLRY
jgi:hypothetical protein